MHNKFLGMIFLGLLLPMSWALASESSNPSFEKKGGFRPKTLTQEHGEEVLDFWDFKIQESEKRRSNAKKNHHYLRTSRHF